MNKWLISTNISDLTKFKPRRVLAVAGILLLGSIISGCASRDRNALADHWNTGWSASSVIEPAAKSPVATQSAYMVRPRRASFGVMKFEGLQPYIRPVRAVFSCWPSWLFAAEVPISTLYSRYWHFVGMPPARFDLRPSSRFLQALLQNRFSIEFDSGDRGRESLVRLSLAQVDSI